MTEQSPRTRLASNLFERALEAAFVIGAALIVYGVSLYQRPAAFIVAGAFLLGGAWLIARKSA